MPAANVEALLPGERLCVLCAGIFFMTALLSGIWKWRCMANSKIGATPRYVDLSHRTSLLYTFAALTLGKFSTLNRLSEDTNLRAVTAPLLYFGLSIAMYVVHGILGDTDNQIAKPRLGRNNPLPVWLTPVFMVSLVVAEIGGFAVLLFGFVDAAYLSSPPPA